MTLPRELTSPIETLDDGKRWITSLAVAGLLFHFEDSPDSIVTGIDGKPLFDPDDVPLIERQVAALYRLDWGDSCPLGYALEYLSACDGG